MEFGLIQLFWLNFLAGEEKDQSPCPIPTIGIDSMHIPNMINLDLYKKPGHPG